MPTAHARTSSLTQMQQGLPTGRAALALLRRLRNRSLLAADANVVLGARMADHLVALGVRPARIVSIPNWADGGTIAPVAPAANALRRHWSLEDRFVVGYSGNLGRAHDIDTILEAIALIDRTQTARSTAASPKIAWLFIGGGNGLDAVRQRVAATRSTSIRFEPYQPREKLAESLSASDVHLVSLRPELEGMIVPSKFYGIAAAGRPAIFIGDADGEIAGVIARAGCGVSVRQGDGAGLAQVILQLAGDPAACATMGVAARRVFEAEYDKPIAVARWQSLLTKAGIRAPRCRQPIPVLIEEGAIGVHQLSVRSILSADSSDSSASNLAPRRRSFRSSGLRGALAPSCLQSHSQLRPRDYILIACAGARCNAGTTDTGDLATRGIWVKFARGAAVSSTEKLHPQAASRGTQVERVWSPPALLRE